MGPALDHHRHLPCGPGVGSRPHHGRPLPVLPARRFARRPDQGGRDRSRGPILPQPTRGDIRHGFVYERVPHITLKAIANNTEIDVIWAKWQATLEPLREQLIITFGPQIQLYYLIALYTLVCTAAMYAFTRTPLGRMLNAVRDNPERVEFIGYNTQFVRYFAFIASGFFMGIAGGLSALNFEIVTAEVVGAQRSGAYLLFTFLGGALFFFGPIIGAVLMVLALVLLSELTPAWQLYLGLIFTFMVMYAPGGISSLIMMNLRVASFGKLRPLLGWYLALAAAAALVFAGAGAMIEMVYHLQINQALGPTLKFLGLTLDAQGVGSRVGAAAVLAAGVLVFEAIRRRFVRLWNRTQEEIERAIEARGAAA